MFDMSLVFRSGWNAGKGESEKKRYSGPIAFGDTLLKSPAAWRKNGE